MPTPGTPAWAEVPTRDPEAARAFYAGLLGWTYDVSTDPDHHGYTIAYSAGEQVAGLFTAPDDATPPGWLLYLHTTDIGETAKQVADLGGTPVLGPFEIPGRGHVLLAVDPGGASIGFWQSTDGYALPQARAGALSWQELNTADPGPADAFYPALFDYRGQQLGDGDQFDYRVWSVGEGEAAGRMRTGSDYPPELADRWMLYFGVDPEVGADAAAAKAAELGGTVLVPPFDSPYGRIAVVTDPSGAPFSLVDLSKAAGQD
ncbi:VOC family protein [Actinosynnema sp. NPDC020468]|uniref:VOC family protein n=1 Tax=Actinosynnema sp. NPDC020468 TaxID=3154488 RepID=UPI0033D3FBE2